MSKISLSLAVSLMIVTGVLGAAVGFAMTPDYQSTMYQKESMDLGPADRSLDRRYINAMISHHRAAMLLADQAKNNATHEEIKELANKILTDEPGAISELYDWKAQWYQDGKKVKDPVVANLGENDDRFDLRFLNALIAHHEAGLDMTKEVKMKSSRTEILNNADAVELFLNNTMRVFKEWRLTWYSI